MDWPMLLTGILTIAAGCGVVFSRKSLHSALWLVTTLVLVGIHFALLEAEFLAVLQVIIYAGAIMVLMLFVIMLLGAEEGIEWQSLRIPRYLSLLLFLLFAGSLWAAAGWASLPLAPAASVQAGAGSAADLGGVLLERYLYPFYLVGVLLLAAVVAAVVLAQDKPRQLPPGRGLRAVHGIGKEQEQSRE